MATQEENAYILGTEKAELHRLGLQHQVWSGEARTGWQLAEFGAGQHILDLGCGPGFCSIDLAYMVGDGGKVIGVDKSEGYINFLKNAAQLHNLNIEAICADFDQMELSSNSLDGVYSRWALAWVPNPEEVLAKIHKALVPGGAFVVHEYYDWSTLQSEPTMPNLKKCIAATLKSFKSSAGEIDIGRKMPELFYEQGFEVINIRPMTKLATPESLTWQWPKTFFHIFFPKLVDMGGLDTDTVKRGLEEMLELEDLPEASILCPHMVEVIGVKV